MTPKDPDGQENVDRQVQKREWGVCQTGKPSTLDAAVDMVDNDSLP